MTSKQLKSQLVKVLNVSIESSIESEIEAKKPQTHRTSFEVYKSNVCHLVKDKGDIDFMIDILENDEIRKLYNRRWYIEAFYLLEMVDYFSRVNDVPICINYNDIRSQSLKETIYPMGVILFDAALHTDKHKNESLMNAIPEFLRFNIVECDVRNVY